MIHSPRFTALLDACVIYPAPIRDLLLNLAEQELYNPVWTKEILEEWKVNLLANRSDLKRISLDKTEMDMNSAFPAANIHSYESLIEGIELPDPDDRHIVASAIRGRADVIVTLNLKDFPSEYLLTNFDLEIISANV